MAKLTAYITDVVGAYRLRKRLNVALLVNIEMRRTIQVIAAAPTRGDISDTLRRCKKLAKTTLKFVEKADDHS